MELWASSYADRPSPVQKFILIFSLIILIGLTAAYIIFLQVNRISSDIMKRPLNILVMGADKENVGENGEKERPRTDTMILVAVNPKHKKVGVFSIPRDSLVEIPGHGTDRINMAHVYGGYKLTKQVVEESLGLTIHSYFMINFEGFKELVDLVGGVEIEVDKRMLYTDKSAGLKIDLEAGKQNLSGEDALGFVRYRRDRLGDITRIGRQRVFLMALAKKMMNKRMIFKIPALIGIGFKYIKTDLSLSEIIAVYRLSRRLNLTNDLFTSTLPGEFSGPYWSLSTEKMNQMLKSFTTGDQ